MELRNVSAFIFPPLPDPDPFLASSFRHKTIELLLNLTNHLIKKYNLHRGKSKKLNMKQEVKKGWKHAQKESERAKHNFEMHDTEHFIPKNELIRIILAFLDKYLGPVR